jgi:hypothetical protein
MRTRLVIVSLAVPALLLGCEFNASVGGGGQLDTDKVETEILNGIEAQTDVEIGSVECPDDVPMEQGNDFTCTATDTGGETAEVSVTQDDDAGNITWELN